MAFVVKSGTTKFDVANMKVTRTFQISVTDGMLVHDDDLYALNKAGFVVVKSIELSAELPKSDQS